MYLREKERKRACVHTNEGNGRKRRRGKSSQADSSLSTEHEAGLNLRVMSHDLSWNQESHASLSHPGIPRIIFNNLRRVPVWLNTISVAQLLLKIGELRNFATNMTPMECSQSIDLSLIASITLTLYINW